VAEEERLSTLLPPGPLADLASDLVREPLPIEAVLARLGAAADEATVRRVRDLSGPGRPRPEVAERQLRRAAVMASIEAVRREQERLLALIARRGAPVADDLQVEAQVAARRRSDLEKRLRALDAAG